MKNLVRYSVLLGVVSFLFYACKNENTDPTRGFVTFSLSQDNIINGRVASGNAAAAVVSIKDNQGRLVYENHKLSLLSFGQGYLSEGVQMGTGNFTLTSFTILNSDNKIIYASPIKNSGKSQFVTDALPIAFNISKEATTQVIPEVLRVSSIDKPSDFGYADFGFKVVDATVTKLKVNVKLLVGEFLYENIDTYIVAKGFDVNNNEKWSKEFAFSGPNENILEIVSGFHHYTISTQKWGVNDSQNLSAKQLSDDRADGPLPVTYVLGGKVRIVKKPVIVFEYSEGPNNTMPIHSRTEYEYNSFGKVERITFYENYSNDSTSRIPSRYQVFTYLGPNGNLAKVTTYYAYSQPEYKAIEDTYEYGVDGNVLRITEANYAAAVTGIMSLSYDPTYTHATAAYRYSNGRGFDYEFNYLFKDIVSDKTTQGSELCNHADYTFDRNINPFKHLGYTSYLLFNDYSVNNRLTENPEYVGCAFPQLIPESYSYKYDNMGYPTEKITHYRGKTQVTATKYYYQEFPQ
ncbi:hypothetical protein WSM22_22720 [Cytophagales bacterium WSM2-2]|nr:hypothetical protein WSM22_22720 [Cytophagales bacterium WSM2-2]